MNFIKEFKNQTPEELDEDFDPNEFLANNKESIKEKLDNTKIHFGIQSNKLRSEDIKEY